MNAPDLPNVGHGQKTVGYIFAQTFEIGAGHESQANLLRSGLHVEGGDHQGGVLAQVDLDVLPLGRGNVVDLVHQFDAGGGGQQDEAGKAGSWDRTVGPQRYNRLHE